MKTNYSILLLTTLFASAGLGACSGSGTLSGPSTSNAAAANSTLDSLSDLTPNVAQVCSSATKPGTAHCHALVRVNKNGVPFKSATVVSGFGPADLQSAYAIPSGTVDATVAIVDAQDDPTAEADLGVYRAQYGLPACTTANGCFQKVNQNGQTTNLPSADSGWSGEISLDLDMVSAACPSCKIILVEADSASQTNLGLALNQAVSMGATVVSNSYGGAEDSSVTEDDTSYFNHPGVAIFVSSGDDAYGVEYPASSQYVTAVGGTSLTKDSSTRGWSETVWSTSSSQGGGSGCSAYITKPSWQTDSGCAYRTVADVAAIGDPQTGVAVYDSYDGNGGWNVYGGTSVASPLVAAIYAQTGNGGATPQFSYTNTASFNDITSGSNGSCSPTYLCTAGAGYDGPTGNGTPIGSAMLNGGAGTGGGSTGGNGGGSTGGSTGGNGGATTGGSTGGSSGGSTGGGGGVCTPDCSNVGCFGPNGCGGFCWENCF